MRSVYELLPGSAPVLSFLILNRLCCLPRKDRVSSGKLLFVAAATAAVLDAVVSLFKCPEPAGRVLSLPRGPDRCFLELLPPPPTLLPGELGGTLPPALSPAPAPALSVEPTEGLRPLDGVPAGFSEDAYYMLMAKKKQ